MSKSYVLIDNDMLVRKTWEFQAQKNNVTLQTFKDVDSFLEMCHEFSKETFIYLDSELDDGKLGEIEGRKIADMGFSKIHLATGKKVDKSTLPDFIMAVASKYPPF